MATSILLKFLTLKWNISRTIWCIEVGDGSYFCIFHALSFKLNIVFDRRFPLTVKHAKFMWKAEHREAWLKLKDALTSAPVLAYFDPNQKSKVIADASPVGLSAILAQKFQVQMTGK